MKNALETAKSKAGGSVGLATAIETETGERITPQAVSQWDQVPAKRVLVVERITGVSRHDLRPDIYGEATSEATQ